MVAYVATLALVISIALIVLSAYVTWLASTSGSQRGLRPLALFFLGLAGLGTTAFLPRFEGSPNVVSWAVSYSFETACVALLPVFAFHAVGRSLDRRFALGYYALWGVTLAAKAWVVVSNPGPWWRTSIALVDTGLTLASLVVVLLGRAAISNPATRRLMARVIVTILVFAPLLFYNCIGIPGLQPFLDAYVAQAIFFSVLSSVILIDARKWLGSLFLRPAPGPEAPGRASQLMESLSARQREIVEGILAGESAKEIAARLGIRPKTAENHTYAVFRKVGARNRIQFYQIMKDERPLNDPAANGSRSRH